MNPPARLSSIARASSAIARRRLAVGIARRRAARRRRRPRAAARRAGRCRAAARRARPRGAAPPPEPNTSDVMFSITPTTRMPVFCAIDRGARRDLLRERLRRRHDHRLGARQQLAERDRDVAGPGRHVDDEHVELAPVHVLQELLERTVQHRPAPHHRLVVVEEEADRHQPQIVRDRRHDHLVDDAPASGGCRACAGSSGRRCRRRGCRPRGPALRAPRRGSTVSDDLPTPPLPEATASTRVFGESRMPFDSTPPRSFVVSAARSSGDITSNCERHLRDAGQRADVLGHLVLEARAERAADDGQRDRDRDLASRRS